MTASTVTGAQLEPNDKQLSQLRTKKLALSFKASISFQISIYLITSTYRYRKLSKAERKERIEHNPDVVGLANRMRHCHHNSRADNNSALRSLAH